MGQRTQQLTEKHIQFIAEQHLFFVGSAAPTGLINVSPKGMDTLRVLGPNRVIWLNLTGSGNETAAHMAESPRMTLMFCAFQGPPNILRLYGTATVIHPRDPAWPDLLERFPAIAGARQIFDLNVELVQTSCGMAVPYYHYVGERDQLKLWAEKKGDDGLQAYWNEKNRTSLDGRPTHIN